jgi:hypothetical protein
MAKTLVKIVKPMQEVINDCVADQEAYNYHMVDQKIVHLEGQTKVMLVFAYRGDQ